MDTRSVTLIRTIYHRNFSYISTEIFADKQTKTSTFKELISSKQQVGVVTSHDTKKWTPLDRMKAYINIDYGHVSQIMRLWKTNYYYYWHYNPNTHITRELRLLLNNNTTNQSLNTRSTVSTDVHSLLTQSRQSPLLYSHMSHLPVNRYAALSISISDVNLLVKYVCGKKTVTDFLPFFTGKIW